MKLITTDQLAEDLQIPVKTLYGWRYAGKGPRAIRLGKHLRYRREDVEAWLEKQAEAGMVRDRKKAAAGA